MKARQQGSTDFEEIFKESTATLLAEVNNLKKIIGRFSDFSKMPAPQLQSVDLNALLGETVKLFAPQLASANPPIRLLTEFTSEVTTISGDPDLLRRAFENLVLNAIDAMPQGGRLRVSTSASADQVPGSLKKRVADSLLLTTPRNSTVPDWDSRSFSRSSAITTPEFPSPAGQARARLSAWNSDA
jgi:signal transduction histidine kinase